MSQLLNWLKSFLKYEPALVAWGLNGGIALVLAYAFHLSRTGEAAVATIAVALASLWTALQARPVSVSVVTGIVGTIAGALAAFHYHPSAELLAMIDAALSAFLPVVFSLRTVPVAALREGLASRPLRKAAPEGLREPQGSL